jgi:hypothetical protein
MMRNVLVAGLYISLIMAMINQLDGDMLDAIYYLVFAVFFMVTIGIGDLKKQ